MFSVSSPFHCFQVREFDAELHIHATQMTLHVLMVLSDPDVILWPTLDFIAHVGLECLPPTPPGPQ